LQQRTGLRVPEFIVGSCDFCTGGCNNRTCAREAEESLLLEAVTRKRLDIAQQARKGLAGAAVIFKVCRSAVAL
jgi:hypothetical protein